MNTIFLISFFLSAGLMSGFCLQRFEIIFRVAECVALAALCFLLFSLGAQLGADAFLLSQIPEFGYIALCLALFCAVGSVCALWVGKFLLPEYWSCEAWPESHGEVKRIDGSVLVHTGGMTVLFIAGVTLAALQYLPESLCGGHYIETVLWTLIFAVGITLGKKIEFIGILKKHGLRLFLIPFLIILGTCAGAVAAAQILPQISCRQALCVGAGLSYYSLSSVIISDTGDAGLASIALLANVIRELLGIVSAHFLARHVSPLAPIGVAAAAAMDTCLPIIARFSGERFVLPALASGLILSLLVPIAVTLFLS